MNPKLYQLLVGPFASLGSVLFGYDLGVIGGVVASDAFRNNFNDPSTNEIGAVVSVFTGGAFFGAAFAGPSGDYFGRRLTIMIGAIIFILGSALQTSAQNLGYLYSGRAIAGIGVGFLVMIVPLYQAEITHPTTRGRLTGLQQFMIGNGAIVAVYCTYGTNRNLIPAGILALLILLFPESPRWLMDHDKTDQALATLARLHSRGDTSDSYVQAEFQQITEQIQDERQNAASGYKELFNNKSSLRRLILVTAIQASVQMTGVSAIQCFAPDIYKQVGVSTNDALKYQGIGYAVSIVAQLCTILFIDKTGRRWPMIIGNLVCSCCFIVTAAVIARFNSVDASTQNSLLWLFIGFGWLFQFSFSFTCGSLSWVIPSEVFDTRTRSKGVSIGVMASFAFNTMIGQITAPAIESQGWRYFLLFVICNIANAIFFWAFLPETARRPLEEMNYLFSSTSWFVPGTSWKSTPSELMERSENLEAKRATMQVEDVTN
ncbi:Putative major facilitator, sugar transporter, major facilitator superfamily [Septoria linicola]|uniref:Major facilitator, sugar transporter, major facilitator superfamily n=1 Tax=Septoria linicola TaxID=215465 RepID=A0A9Q9AKY3_9PEZI|nr:Putative major facilitator, sugar transporter, major facilitator superfamily [Septoria linicola]